MHDVESAIYPVVEFARSHLLVNQWDAAKVVSTAYFKLVACGDEAEQNEVAKIIMSVDCKVSKKHHNLECGIRINEWDALDAIFEIQKIFGYGFFSKRFRRKLTKIVENSNLFKARTTLIEVLKAAY